MARSIKPMIKMLLATLLGLLCANQAQSQQVIPPPILVNPPAVQQVFATRTSANPTFANKTFAKEPFVQQPTPYAQTFDEPIQECGCGSGLETGRCQTCLLGRLRGRIHARCPRCNEEGICQLTESQGKEKRSYYKVDSKQICIPAIRLPWQSCEFKCGSTRTIRVLKKESHECPKCEYEWTVAETGCASCEQPTTEFQPAPQSSILQAPQARSIPGASIFGRHTTTKTPPVVSSRILTNPTLTSPPIVQSATLVEKQMVPAANRPPTTASPIIRQSSKTPLIRRRR